MAIEFTVYFELYFLGQYLSRRVCVEAGHLQAEHGADQRNQAASGTFHGPSLLSCFIYKNTSADRYTELKYLGWGGGNI